jgi:hypothetical protein
MLKIILCTILITTSSLLFIGYYSKKEIAEKIGFIPEIRLSKKDNKISNAKEKAKGFKINAKKGLVKRVSKRGVALGSSYIPLVGGAITTTAIMAIMIDDFCKNQQQFTNIINILDDKPEVEDDNLEACLTETGTYLKTEASSEATGFIDDANEWIKKAQDDANFSLPDFSEDYENMTNKAGEIGNYLFGEDNQKISE